MVKTRTVVQVRTHAQKYFLKLEKSSGPSSGKALDFQEYDGSRSNSISSFSSIDSSGNTTVDWETDSEREILNEFYQADYDSKLVNSPICTNRSNKLLKAEPSRKRGRNKPIDGEQQRKRVVTSPSHSGFRFDENDHFCELLSFEPHTDDDLDASIVNLLDRIEWEEIHQFEGHSSRCNSPFTKSAKYLSCALIDTEPSLQQELSARETITTKQIEIPEICSVEPGNKLINHEVTEEFKMIAVTYVTSQHHIDSKNVLSSIHALESFAPSSTDSVTDDIHPLVDNSYCFYDGVTIGASKLPLIFADFDTWSHAVSSVPG